MGRWPVFSAGFYLRYLRLLGVDYLGFGSVDESAVAKRGEDYRRETPAPGLKPEDFAARRQSDPEIVAIAMRLRRETVIKPIASRLNLGTPKSASTRLREWQIAHADPTHPFHAPTE